MRTWIAVAIALVIGIIVGASINRYQAAPSPGGTVYVVDRIFGSVRFCTRADCIRIVDREVGSRPDFSGASTPSTNPFDRFDVPNEKRQ